MLEALRQAAASDFIAGLRDGLDTIVGDRGILPQEADP
jgi:ABC-type multidrug transport system fused ATPase/permease subunit